MPLQALSDDAETGEHGEEGEFNLLRVSPSPYLFLVSSLYLAFYHSILVFF
jgi:hypothetical protein